MTIKDNIITIDHHKVECINAKAAIDVAIEIAVTCKLLNMRTSSVIGLMSKIFRDVDAIAVYKEMGIDLDQFYIDDRVIRISFGEDITDDELVEMMAENMKNMPKFTFVSHVEYDSFYWDVGAHGRCNVHRYGERSFNVFPINENCCVGLLPCGNDVLENIYLMLKEWDSQPLSLTKWSVVYGKEN